MSTTDGINPSSEQRLLPGTVQGLVDFMGSGSRQGFRELFVINEMLDAFRYQAVPCRIGKCCETG